MTFPRGRSPFQQLIEDIYYQKDSARGVPGTLLWFVEEVGELVRAVRRGDRDRQNLQEEFADVYAWLCTLASLHQLDLDGPAMAKYQEGCPRCKSCPCACSE